MERERLYFIDWLRVSVILSLIPYHAALTYTGLGEIYIKKPITGPRVIPFIFMTMPLDNFFMTLLFFISGISTYYSLKSRSNGLYIKERINKLFKPFLLGTILLSPIQAYSMALYNGFSGNILCFIPEFFSARIVYYLGYAHLWFLLYLFVFSIACYPFFRWCLEHRNKVRGLVDTLISKQNIYVPIIWIVVVEWLLRPHFPGMQILIMDWANDVVYLSVFIFGFIYAFDQRIRERIDSLFTISIAMVLASGISLFLTYYYWLIINGDNFEVTRVWALSKGIYESFLIILLMILGRRYFNKSNNVLRYLKESSFRFYLYHMLPVTYITLIVINWNIDDYIKYLVTVFLSLIAMVITHRALKNFTKY